MRNFERMVAVVLGLFLCAAPAVRAQGADTSGNQLMKGYVHWYEQPALTVGPVKGMTDQAGALSLQPGSFLYMEGDSTLHKYQMTAKVLEGSAVLKGAAPKSLLKALQTGQVKAMTLVIPLATLNSRDSGLDKNAYQALLAKVYPEIKFKLTGETLTAGAAPDAYVLTALGTVMVAGASAPVTLTADASFQNDQVRLKGIQKLKMTDFKIKPPTMTLLVISITCTDEIEIHYDVTFAAK
jgi:hypothetical protein